MSDRPPRGWNTPTPEQAAATKAADEKAASDREEYARLHANVFGSGAGKTLLEKWHRKFVDEALPLTADDRALAVANAQRQFVRAIERLVEAGMKPKAT